MTHASYGEVLGGNRNFRLLWIATLVSLFGDWFNTITLYALVTDLTGSPLAVGLIEFLKLGGFAAASIPGGILADRFDRRRLMIATDLLRAALVPCYLLIDHADEVPFLYALVFLQVALGGIFDPAYRALMPNLVSPRELVTANAIMAITWSTILAVGASLGGFVTTALGTDTVFLIDAASYLVSALCLIAIRAPIALEVARRATQSAQGVASAAWRDLAEGIHYLRTHRDILRLAMAKTTWSVGGAGLLYLLTQIGPLLTPGDSALGIGILYSARGLGSGIGPILARRADERRWVAMLGLCVALSGLLYMVIAFLPWSFWICLPIAIAHGASGANWVLSTILLQGRVPDRVRGRVFSAELVFLTAFEAGFVLMAASLLEAQALTIVSALLVFGALQTCSGLAYWRWTRDLDPTAKPISD
jgi:hypothetical protein